MSLQSVRSVLLPRAYWHSSPCSLNAMNTQIPSDLDRVRPCSLDNQKLVGTLECRFGIRSHISKRRLILSSQRRRIRLHEPMDRKVGGRHEHRLTSKCFVQREARENSTLKEIETLSKQEFTVDEAIEAVGFGDFQKFLLIYAGMAWTAEAMEMMLLSFVGPSLKDVWNLSPQQESLITSVVFVGMMVGAYSWGVLSDARGRRVGFFGTAVLTFVAGLLSSLSPNYATLVLLRGFVGLGLGGGPVVSTWFLEFVPSSNRGLWMVVVSCFWTLGSVLEALLAWAVMPHSGWRWLLGLSSLPLAVLLVFYPLVPESPRYLAAKGEVKGATNVLQRMALVNGKTLPSGTLLSSLSMGIGIELTDGQLEDVEYAQVGNRKKDADGSESKLVVPDEDGFQGSPRVWEVEQQPLSSSTTALEPFPQCSLLLSPSLIRSTLLLWSVFLANAFTYYGLVLLSSQLSAGAGGCVVDVAVQSSPDAAAGSLYRDVFVTSLAELPGLAVAASVADKYGRKPSMAGLFALCGLFLLPLLQPQGEILTTGLLFGARASIMGAFTVLYIYAPEVYPTSVRSTGLGIANAFGRVGGILCPLVAVYLVESCQQPLAIGVFTLVTAAASVMASNLPLETTGRPLSDFPPDLQEPS